MIQPRFAQTLLGCRTTMLLGGFLMALGHALMGFEPLFLLGLGCVAVGNGGFKPNITSQARNRQTAERHGPRTE